MYLGRKGPAQFKSLLILPELICFESHGPGGHSPWICHQSEMTEKAWKNPVQEICTGADPGFT